MTRDAGRRPGTAAVALLLVAALQVVLADGIQQKSNTLSAQAPHNEVHQLSGIVHGIQKRSVSILARNGDLPYFRKEWNKKLHPGFRGMNVEDKEEESVPSKRYVGSLARVGGYPGGGKRSELEDSSEEEPLEAYIPEDWSGEDFTEDNRGGISSLARAKGYVTYQGQYGKRSVAALARSGELLSIGRGSNPERDSGSASKRGLGSILRSGGISTIGKIPVYSMGTATNGKRGIESLARNYALPSMINQEYEGKLDVPVEELENSGSLMYRFDEETENDGEDIAVDPVELIAKRHLGSFVRTYGFKPGTKRNIGSLLRNGGGFGYSGKRSELFSPPRAYSISNDKRHISSLLKNHPDFSPYKRATEEDVDYDGFEKRHLSSILHDGNGFTNGKSYLGRMTRQGFLESRQEKKKDMEWGMNEGSRGDWSVGKRSIAEGDSGLLKGEASFGQQDNSTSANETTEDELRNSALQKRSHRGETRTVDEETPKRRQRRSLAFPYSSSDEYPMPVLQNTDFYDLGNTEEEELDGLPGKRFMVSPRRYTGRRRRNAGEGAGVGGQRQPRVAGAAAPSL